MKKKKKYQRIRLKVIKFKDINFKANMAIVDWRGFTQWTTGEECGGIPP